MSFAAAADVRVGVLDGEDACKPAAVGVRVGVLDGAGTGVSVAVGGLVGVAVGSGACEPVSGLAGVACSSSYTRVDSAPICVVRVVCCVKRTASRMSAATTAAILRSR